MSERSALKELYENLSKHDYYVPIVLHHSTVHFVKAALQVTDPELIDTPPEAVREAAKAMSLEDLEKILFEEGFLPHDEHSFPERFARRWLNAGKSIPEGGSDEEFRTWHSASSADDVRS